MAVGAKDRIDAMLVKKYATARMDNPIVESSMIDPDKMYEAMNDYAQAHLSMLHLHQQLKGLCTKVIAPSIHYTKSRNIKTKKSRMAAAAGQ